MATELEKLETLLSQTILEAGEKIADLESNLATEVDLTLRQEAEGIEHARAMGVLEGRHRDAVEATRTAEARVAELQGILDAATVDHGTTSGQLREAMDRVSELEDKCKRLEGQPREAWEKRQLVSGCNSMVVDVWFPRSTAHRFDGQCILLPDQSGESAIRGDEVGHIDRETMAWVRDDEATDLEEQELRGRILDTNRRAIWSHKRWAGIDQSGEGGK